MNYELPSYLTPDAVPEKRTIDEENQPPSSQEAQEYVRRAESISSSDQSGEKRSSKESNQPQAEDSKQKPQSATEGTSEKVESSSKKKTKKSDGKSSKKPSQVTNIVNISHSNGFQICNYTNISNFMDGGGMFPKPNFNVSQKPSDPPPRPSAPIPEKVFKCLDRVSEEDCRLVSEYITCDWKKLAEQLFEDEMLKNIFTPEERNTKKESVRLILIRWKQVNGKTADVRQLCLALQKLDETDALVRLANRHGFK